MYRTKSLQHVFVSIKGYYYQAQVAGNKVTWLVPHAFTQNVPKDLDYSVMLTFLQFYETVSWTVVRRCAVCFMLAAPPLLSVIMILCCCDIFSIRLRQFNACGRLPFSVWKVRL